MVGASRRRLAQPELLARDVITHGSAQLRTLGRPIRTGAAMAAVFQEDLKNTSRKIFDPQDRILVRLNRSFLISCIISIAIDPMFFYGPRVREEQLPGEKNTNLCIGIDHGLAISTAVVCTLFDIFSLARIVLQFHTAFTAPSSRVFGHGELVIDTVEIAKRYSRRFFITDIFSVLLLSPMVIWKFLYRENKTAVLET
jgi:cyclic nucleotide gated channel, plant